MLIYKNIDEFGIVCKKKECSTRKLRSFCLVRFFFFLSSFFFIFIFYLFIFFPLRNVKVGGAAYTAVRPLRQQIR